MGCGCSTAKNFEQSSNAEVLPVEPLSPSTVALFSELFGDKLLSKGGQISVEAALSGKQAVAIYFSAHWCPPCRGFTPELAKSYTKYLKPKGMEIVFVSSDRSGSDFEGYYKEMPWLAVPYEKRDIHQSLNKKFKVQGIPTLVILDMNGQVISKDGRSKVMSDPQGSSFPWKPKPFTEVIGDNFRRGDAVVNRDAILGKTLGIYFSAHWCPPCRAFTPILANHYKAYKEKGLPFEVVFCSGDKDEASFEGYCKEMALEGGDWLCLPWSSAGQRQALNELFEVQGIPCLVIVDENGHVINSNARGAVGSDPLGEAFPWQPPAVGNLNCPEGISDSASVCIFMEGAPSEQQKAVLSELESVAKKFIEDGKAKGEDQAYRFYVATDGTGAVPRIREVCGLPKDTQGQLAMLILNIDDDGAFYMSDAVDITASTVESFIKAFETKAIPRQQMAK